jgi:hypothetical protein
MLGFAGLDLMGDTQGWPRRRARAPSQGPCVRPSRHAASSRRRRAARAKAVGCPMVCAISVPPLLADTGLSSLALWSHVSASNRQVGI